jgi:hypothetical protein
MFGHVTVAAKKKTTISDTDDCQLPTLVNSASAAPPIGLAPKGAKFCHTPNRLLVGCRYRVPYRNCILIPLQSVSHWLLVVGRWLLVGQLIITAPGLWKVSLQKGYIQLRRYKKQ